MAKTETKLTDEERADIAALLQALAESEHHLRHPKAFARLCAAAGYTCTKKGSRFEILQD